MWGIRTITLSGTISVTYNGQQVPYVVILAETQNEYGYCDNLLGRTNLSSPANGISWSITMEAPSSVKTVYFDVACGNKDGWLFRDYFSPVSVYNQDKSGIALNLGNITK